jgi:protein involved in polysaccharide export with SLBB domain
MWVINYKKGSKMDTKKIFLRLNLMLLPFVLAGCFSSHPADIKAFTRPEQVAVTSDKYILQPPDEIEIHCLKVAELNLQRQRIRPDGKVSFEGLGEIEVAGKTIGEVANIMKQQTQKLYTLVGNDPIDVRVVAYRSQFFYVIGEVAYPGAKTYTGRDTLLNALATANPTVLAWKERIQVIRPSADKNIKPKIFEVNFDRMFAHGDGSKNVLLQEGDIIFVPPTILAAIAMKVEEFVRPILRVFATSYYVGGAGMGGGGGGYGY